MGAKFLFALPNVSAVIFKCGQIEHGNSIASVQRKDSLYSFSRANRSNEGN